MSLDGTRSFAAHDLKLSAEDIDLTMPEGTVFVASIDQGVTALVLLGRGMVNFHPTPAMERGQVRIYSGSDVLETRFDSLYVRVNPADFERTVNAAQLQSKPVDPRELRRAQDVFREESQKSFVIDLGDLSRDAWSLLPGSGDFLAEIRTRRDSLTYAKSSSEAEDITLFDRRHHHNIAIYASAQKLASRGRFYNEDELVEYDVLDYDIDVAVTPERSWIDGHVRMHLRVRAAALGALKLRLADSLTVHSVVSYEQGRLFGIRIKGQNTFLVNLPTPVAKDSELTLSIAYGGRLEPQTADREALTFDQRATVTEDAPLMARPSRVFSTAAAATGIRRRRSATTQPHASESPCPRRSSASPAASSNRDFPDCSSATSRVRVARCMCSRPRDRCAISLSSSAVSSGRRPAPWRSRRSGPELTW